MSKIVSIITIIMFVLIAGASPSVVRAGIMAIILVFSKLLSKNPNTLSTISFTALIMLIINPFILCDIGFILSFGGTIGIVLLSKRINFKISERYVLFNNNNIFKIILETFSVTLSAQLILFPIMCYYFNTVSLISILTNLLVCPFVEFITILGLILYILSLIFFPLAKLIAYVLITLISFLISISSFCSSLPFANILITTPKFFHIVLYYIILMKIFNRKSVLKSDRISRNILNLISLLIILNIILSAYIPKNYIEVNFIDVGQGDSIHIKTPHGKNILIDGGGSEGSDYDIGEKVLIPYILDNTNGIIDVIFISHFHEDHVEGIISLLKKIKVNKIIIGIQNELNNLYFEVLDIAAKKNIPIITLKANEEIIIDEAKFKILYPKAKVEDNNLNNSSLIIKGNFYNTSILFTGDSELEEEINLIKMYKNNPNILKCDLLKVGHHGSKTSSSNNFLSIIKPSISIISCGIDNKFGHPNETTLCNLNNIKSKIYRTDINGEIMLKIYKDKVKINTMVND